MILETIVSTINQKRKVNFAPFGIKKKSKNIIISPYIPSITLQNLRYNNCAVINYVDDASFYVNCILGKKNFKKKKTQIIDGFFLVNSLSYDEVVVKKIIEDSVRPSFICEVVKSVSKKKYDGHNRAKAAIIEACILASRVKLLKKKKILDELNYLSIGVEKTAGNLEKKSWEKIKNFILDKINESK
jgi:hypothetical protein